MRLNFLGGNSILLIIFPQHRKRTRVLFSQKIIHKYVGNNIKMNPSKIGIAIIESLPSTEKQTGEELFNSTLKYVSFQKTFLDNELHKVENKEELLKVLNELYVNAIDNQKFYFLHFEIHGNDDGVSLKNGDFVFWSEILPLFRNLNILYKNNLSIYLAVCKGNSLLRFINPIDRSPFGVIIGSFNNIYNYDIINYFENFYTKFFDKFSIFDAYNTVKKINLKSEFSLISSHHVIKHLLELQKESKDKELIVNALNESFGKIENQSKNIGIVYEYLNQEVNRIFTEYEIKEDFFLMNDLE